MGGNSGRFPVWRARDVEGACACASVLVGVSRCLVSLQRSLKVHAPRRSNDRRLAPMILACGCQAFFAPLCACRPQGAPLGAEACEHRIISVRCTSHLPSRSPRHHVHLASLLAPPPGTSAACISSAASRLPTMTQMAHPSFRASWASVNFVRKTVVAECRQRPSSSIIITLRRLEPQGNDSRRLQLSDAPPKLYPTCYPLAVGLVHRTRDTVQSDLHCRPDSALGQLHRFLALHQANTQKHNHIGANRSRRGISNHVQRFACWSQIYMLLVTDPKY